MVHRARVYSGFCCMKRLGVFLLPPQGYPQHKIRRYPCIRVERGTVRVKCLDNWRHYTMSPARDRTRTAWFGDEHTNHEATASPKLQSLTANILLNDRLWTASSWKARKGNGWERSGRGEDGVGVVASSLPPFLSFFSRILLTPYSTREPVHRLF